MTPEPDALDGRAALKARTRLAIVDAARSLMLASGSTRFTVDELAAQAGVARRTVFNHFESLDAVVAAVGSEAFSTVLTALRQQVPPAGPQDDARAAVVADLAGAFRRADLVGPMAALSRGLGLTPETVATPTAVPATQALLLLRSLSELGEALATALLQRHPDADRVDVDLAVAAFTSGLVVLHRHWLARCGASDDAEGRAAWGRLLDHLTDPPAPIEGPHG